ncbi:MAG: hypothetical protein J5I93_17675, partial [Pirellulaceae bacterium]|nr:hypothetical protein [Pirellulaceae bacterium]
MKDEAQDPILDACLDEVLGEIQPPDLTSRILAAWSARQAEAASQSGIPLPAAGTAPAVSEPIPPPIQKLGGCGPAAAFSDSPLANASPTAGTSPQVSLAARSADSFASSGRRARKSTAAQAWTAPAVVACLLLVAAVGAAVIFRGAWSADGTAADRT